MSTRILSAFEFLFFKILSASKMLYSFKNYVALLPWFRDCHFDGSFSINVRYVTCSHGTDCHAESQAGGGFSVSRWLKLTQFHLFTPLFDCKKQLCNRKTFTRYEKRTFQAVNIHFSWLLCVSKFEEFTQLPPDYHENSWTSMVSYKDFLQQTKPIPRYVLKDCLNVWFN